MSKLKLPNSYKLASVFLTVFCIVSGFLIGVVYKNGKVIYSSNLMAVEYLDKINSEINTVNENILLLVSDMNNNNNADSVTLINNAFTETSEYMDKYESIENLTDLEKRRYNQCRLSILSYHKKLNEVFETLQTFGNETAKSVYFQEIQPIQACMNEMLSATIELSEDSADASISQNDLIAKWIGIGLLIVLILGNTIIIAGGNKAYRTSLNIAEKNKELAKASKKLESSHKKMVDIARMNLITDMNNRYALEDSIGEMLEKEQFDIAVIDIDNFRTINDTYGYEVGDEYLATISEKLKKDFSNIAYLYNITGNEFCFLFKNDVASAHAQQLIEQIRKSVESPTTVAGGIVIKSLASASFYHYTPIDKLNLNSLLMKLDTALHAAKRDGGNRTYYIN